MLVISQALLTRSQLSSLTPSFHWLGAVSVPSLWLLSSEKSSRCRTFWTLLWQVVSLLEPPAAFSAILQVPSASVCLQELFLASASDTLPKNLKDGLDFTTLAESTTCTVCLGFWVVFSAPSQLHLTHLILWLTKLRCLTCHSIQHLEQIPTFTGVHSISRGDVRLQQFSYQWASGSGSVSLPGSW